MRWIEKKEEAPRDGDVRHRRAFAWRPFEVAGYTVWLESYGIEERFFAPASGNPGWWSVNRYYTLDYYC